LVAQERRDGLTRRIEEGYEALAGDRGRRAEIEALPRRELKRSREELSWVKSSESRTRRQIERLEAEAKENPLPAIPLAGSGFAVADQVLAERRRLAITAARVKELGERPGEPVKRDAWDRGVSHIESYRQRNGVTDPSHAFGEEAKRGAERARQERAQRRLLEAQRALGLGQPGANARPWALAGNRTLGRSA
jgi:hypothetical protein